MNLNKEDHSFLTNKKSNKIIPPITKLPPLYNYNNPVSKIKRYTFFLFKQDPKLVKIYYLFNTIQYR